MAIKFYKITIFLNLLLRLKFSQLYKNLEILKTFKKLGSFIISDGTVHTKVIFKKVIGKA